MFEGINPIAFVPFGFAVLELAWTFGWICVVADRRGKPLSRRELHRLDLIGMAPAVIGIIAAIVIPFLWPLTLREIIVVISGAIACVPMILVFGKEFFTP